MFITEETLKVSSIMGSAWEAALIKSEIECGANLMKQKGNGVYGNFESSTSV